MQSDANHETNIGISPIEPSYDGPPPNYLISYEELYELNDASADITVMRDGHLGDLVMLSATLDLLHRTFPSIGVNIAVKKQYLPLFSAETEVINEVYSIDEYSSTSPEPLDLRGYVEYHDCVWLIDRSSLFCRAFDLVPYNLQPICFVKDFWCGFEELPFTEGDFPIAIIAADGSDPARSFANDVIEQFSDRLTQEGYRVVVVGNERGEGFSIPVLAKLLHLAGIDDDNILVSTDNGVYHLSEAVGGPEAYVVFTTISPELRCRWYDNVTPIVPDIHCAPCNTGLSTCSYGAKCQLDIDVDTMMENVV